MRALDSVLRRWTPGLLAVLFVGGHQQVESVAEFWPLTPQLRTVVVFDEEGVQPDGAGFVTLSVVDAEGRSDVATVFLE